MAILGLSGYINSGKDTVGKMIQFLDSQKKGYNGTFDDWYLTSDRGLYPTTWEIKKFAGKLKEIATMLTGIPTEKFEDQEFKKSYLGEEWGTKAGVNMAHKDVIDFDRYKVTSDIGLGFKNAIRLMTVREFLQKLGTDGLREGLHQNVWVNALFADYKRPYKDKYYPEGVGDLPNWIITDVRFPNEAQAIKDRGGIVVRISRRASIDDEMIWGTNPLRHPSETSLDDWEFDYKINNSGTLEELLEETRFLLNNIKN